MSRESNSDVIVVGAGNAALVAAISAYNAGARVTVLESAPHAERGGNSRFSGAGFRFVHSGLESLVPLLTPEGRGMAKYSAVDGYSAAEYTADIKDTSGGRADPLLADVLVNNSYETVRWMAEQGVRWELTTKKFVRPEQMSVDHPCVLPPGLPIRGLDAGEGLIADLFRIVESKNIDVRYENHAFGLVMDGRTVVGVKVRSPEGTHELRGRVILACGGFEASPEMRVRYLGPGWDVVKVRGTRFNTGVMLDEALRSGAVSYGQWSGCHATPVSTLSPEFGELELGDDSARHCYTYGLLVNMDGHRFVDEGEAVYVNTYAKIGPMIRSQPRARAVEIFDQQTVFALQPRYDTEEPIVADTIEELAVKVGIPSDPLVETVAAYNASVQNVAGFDPHVEDKVSTVGIKPPKTSWAIRLDDPPFVAYPVTCGITFTYGGLRIDNDARVLDGSGAPIEGLYATGEITGGFFYDNYPGGAGLMRGAVFGRRAGENAARAQR